MKKFLRYLGILIILAGLCSPILKVSAQPTSTPDTSNNQSYHLLEPIPDPTTADGKPITDFPVGETGALGKYLNLAIKLFIGLCAVAAVVMIVIGGIEYSTSELISTKSAAKDRIQNAIFGLLLALGSYTILFTINPDLLNTEVDIGGATLTSSGEQVILDLKEYVVSGSGPQTIDGKSAKINFKAQACPAAYAAASRYGIRPALVLGIFDQETGAGRNTGRCTANNGSNIDPRQLPALQRIANRYFNGNINSVPMSCDPGPGRGGALGLMQFLPQTWESYGSGGNPWQINDAMMGAAAYLKAGGAPGNEKQAACKYISGLGGGCGSTQANIYGTSVINKAAAYQKKIDAGGCNP